MEHASEVNVATEEQVDLALASLLGRIDGVDGRVRSLLPRQRTLEIRCPDVDLVRHAEWRSGRVRVDEGPANERPDIRLSVRSDDLVAIESGELAFADAYASNRLRVDASLADRLRLRALL